MFFSVCRPNVCVEQEKILRHETQPCVQTFTRMVKVWKQGCVGHPWCMSHERRCVYCMCACVPLHLSLHSSVSEMQRLIFSSHSRACTNLNSVFNLYLTIALADCLTDHICARSVCHIIIYSQLWLQKTLGCNLRQLSMLCKQSLTGCHRLSQHTRMPVHSPIEKTTCFKHTTFYL